jgi:phage-related protein
VLVIVEQAYKKLYISDMATKPLFWVGSALKDLREFPADARRDAGHELHLVQMGLAPSDWKPMPGVGPGVVEVRIHSAEEHRVFYVAKFAEAIYVLHAFRKTTQKTSKQDIETGSKRYRDVLRHQQSARGGFHE